MEIYADLFILTNCLCDGILLHLTALFLNRRVKAHRLILSCILGGIYSLLYLLLFPSPIILSLLSVCFSLLMVFLTFGFHSLLSFLKPVFFFYLLGFLAGGMISSLQNTLLTYWALDPSFALFILLILFSLLFACLIIIKALFTQKSRSATLSFTVNHQSYKVLGLLDSGNLLFDPRSCFPVVLLDPDFLKEHPPCDRSITLQTVAGARELPAFLPQNAAINGIPRKICIALCPPPKGGFGKHPALLPYLQ